MAVKIFISEVNNVTEDLTSALQSRSMASICIMCSRDTVPGKRRKLSSYDDVVFIQ